MRRLKFIFATSVAVVALIAPGVASAQYTPTTLPTVSGGDLVLGSGSVAPGGSVVIGGSGCQANSVVDVGISSGESGSALGTADADASGNFEATVVIPADLAPGDYELVALCTSADGTSTLRFASALTVTAGTTGTTAPGGPPGLTPAAPGATLPRTGADSSLPITQVAVAMLAAGSLLVALVWRRRQAADAVSVDA